MKGIITTNDMCLVEHLERECPGWIVFVSDMSKVVEFHVIPKVK